MILPKWLIWSGPSPSHAPADLSKQLSELEGVHHRFLISWRVPDSTSFKRDWEIVLVKDEPVLEIKMLQNEIFFYLK